MLKRTLLPPASRQPSFLAVDHAVRGFRERWYPSLVDWQGEPPPLKEGL